MSRVLPLFAPVALPIFTLEPRALLPRSAVIVPASASEDRRIAVLQDVERMLALSTVIEPGRAGLMKLLVPARIHEVRHLEGVYRESVLFDRIGDFEGVHAEADSLHAKGDRGIDEHFRNFVRGGERDFVLECLRVQSIGSGEVVLEDTEEHFCQREAVGSQIVPAVVAGLRLRIHEQQRPAAGSRPPTDSQPRGDAPDWTKVLVDETLRGADECSKIETQRRLRIDDATDFGDDGRREKSRGDQSARARGGHGLGYGRILLRSRRAPVE